MASKNQTRASITALALVLIIAAGVFTLDYTVKSLALSYFEVGVPTPVLGEFLQFTLVLNPGAAFSLASGMTWIFSIAASAVFIAIIVLTPQLRSRAWVVFFGLLLGGVLGNLFDRLFREPGFGVGHVVDMIQVWIFPAIFNVADIFIVGSMGFFIVISLLGIRMDGSRERSEAEKTEDIDAADTADSADTADTALTSKD